MFRRKKQKLRKALKIPDLRQNHRFGTTDLNNNISVYLA